MDYTSFMILLLPMPPPKKRDLSFPDPKSRYPWNKAFELIGNFFCLSNSFNYSHSSLVVYPFEDQTSLILFVGEKLRYLSPSIRSVGSLFAKAHLKLANSSLHEWSLSTPGIFYSKHHHTELPLNFIFHFDQFLLERRLSFPSELNNIPQNVILFDLTQQNILSPYFELLKRIYV